MDPGGFTPENHKEVSMGAMKEYQEFQEWVADEGIQEVSSGLCYGCDHDYPLHQLKADPSGLFNLCPDCIKKVCPECGEFVPDDARVEEGMRCGACAYPHGD